ncbi:FadR/GntR family transcriptional regulator [Paraburkholderia sp. BCC1884]|uniref:FadR/GntR family transcriptional regulator n=1 Tax=Paraburkholderia sp. BCC1884 TaxID=2562668 RepID=UPI001181DA92|nr:FCD domain-containing protein [Paraburkholderia sp. BCC1884]
MSMPMIAAQTLQSQILAGTYAAGEMLPGQRDLAESLGISRGSLREAISMLEALGFVRSIAGKGTFVSGRNGVLADTETNPILPTQAPSGAIMQLRFLLEPAAASLAARLCDARAAPRLWGVQARFEEALRSLDLVTASQADLEFHQLIAELTGNEHLYQLTHDFEDRITDSVRRPFSNRERVDEPAAEHRAIAAAICARDPAAAMLAMQTHLLNAAARIGISFVQP